MLHITKQLFGGKSVNQKPGLFALAVAARHRRGLRLDGTGSYEADLPLLQQLLSDIRRIGHRSLAAAALRVANSNFELLPERELNSQSRDTHAKQ